MGHVLELGKSQFYICARLRNVLEWPNLPTNEKLWLGRTATAVFSLARSDCRFKTSIAVFLINSMYGDAFVESPH